VPHIEWIVAWSCDDDDESNDKGGVGSAVATSFITTSGPFSMQQRIFEGLVVPKLITAFAILVCELS
jgi:hypothetical protein